MMDLTTLSTEKLSVLFHNVILGLDKPGYAARSEVLINEVQDEFGARVIAKGPGFLPMFACVGYNVQWQGWSDKHRRRLLEWMIDNDLPEIYDADRTAVWGAPGSVERLREIVRTISHYIKRYGSGAFMETAKSRWKNDLAFVESVINVRLEVTNAIV